MDPKDIVNLCKTNSYYNKICNDKVFWETRAYNDFGLPKEFFDKLPLNQMSNYFYIKEVITDPYKSIKKGIISGDPYAVQIGLIYYDDEVINDVDNKIEDILFCDELEYDYNRVGCDIYEKYRKDKNKFNKFNYFRNIFIF